jgi:hypothetical protein
MMAGLASEKWTPFLLGLLAPLLYSEAEEACAVREAEEVQVQVQARDLPDARLPQQIRCSHEQDYAKIRV